MSDAGKKNVFLLNTHLINIMNAPERLIKLLDDIIEIFSKSPEALLLWRPHPLSESTFLSINRSYYEEYQERLRTVSRMSNAIVDTTPDIDRAIALSDAYIGDISSSVTALYEMTGKPMLLIQPLKNVWKVLPVAFSAAGIYKGKIYLSASEFNGLFCKDVKTGKMEYLGKFTTEEYKMRLHRTAYVYGDECWFIPQTGSCITKVNLESLEMYKYEFPNVRDAEPEAPEMLNFVNAVADNYQCLWLIPFDTNTLVKIDMESSKLYFYDSWPIDYVKESFADGTMVGDELWLCPKAAHDIVKVNVKNGQMHTSEWRYSENAFLGFVYADGSLWLVPYDETCVVRWNLKSNEETRIPIPRAHEHECFLGGSVYGGDIWMYPFKATGVLRVNIVSQAIEYVEKGWIPNNVYNAVMRLWNTSDLILITGSDGSFATYNASRGRFEQLYCTLTIEQYREFRSGISASGYSSANQFLFTDCSVEDFVEYVADNDEDAVGDFANVAVDNGRRIWVHIKQAIQ